ncbi:MAG: peptide deformylase [Cyanobacteria bacterium P01_A01_bin.135]
MAPQSELLVEKKKLAKSPLQLHYLGDRVLRQPAKRVTKIDNDTRQFVKQMLQTMYSEDGIGLAAPQVGVHKQILVVDEDPEDATTPPLVLINPVIKGSGQQLCVFKEGCLSVPNVYLDVTRPKMVEVAYKDENGRPQRRRVDEMLSRVIQHEMDHLNGVMFVDRVDNALMLAQELDKHGFSAQSVQAIR